MATSKSSKPTPAKKPATPAKPSPAAKKPATPAKPAAAVKKPTTPAKPAAAVKKPTTPAKPAAAVKKPTTPAKPAAAVKKPTTPAKPAAAVKKPTTPAKPAATAPKPATTAKPAATAPKPATPAKPAATAPKPATPAKPSATAPKPATTAKPAAAAPKPAAKPSGDTAALTKESERRKKIKSTLALLRAEPGWKAFLAEQKKVLMQMRDELLPNMHNVTRDHLRSGDSNVSSSSGQHIGDAGSEAEQRDITILRLDKDREQLFEIDAALQRIEKGTYGVCEISLEPIPRKRLQARPYCRLTVKCQEEYEKKYGSFSNYRNKNSGDVGFSGLQKVIESTIMLDEDEE